jgi:carboxyl-terminal processing protease
MRWLLAAFLACGLLTSCDQSLGKPSLTSAPAGTGSLAATLTPPVSPWPRVPSPTDTKPPGTSPATEMPGPTAAGSQPAADISAEAQAYVDAVLDLMQQHSINREQIDWDALRARTYRRAYGARTTGDTYRAIQYALGDLGGSHSFLMTPEQVAEMEDGSLNASVPAPSGRLLAGKLAYVSLPAFAGSMEAAAEHATAIQQIIRDLDAEKPCGWIVDLRENLGGSMWPMLAGIGPILGEGLVGKFVAPDGSETAWYYMDGQALEGNAVQTEVRGAVYELDQPLPPVAVLIGPSTCSSGEAIVVAFRGRPDTRSFGEATAGLSTANQDFALSDGAWLLLTVSRFADRTGQTYGSTLVPDEIIHQQPGQGDAALQAGEDWLLGQPACDPGQ